MLTCLSASTVRIGPVFVPSKNEPSPGTRYERSSRGTHRTACGNGTPRPRPSLTAKTTSSSSTTECPRRPAHPSRTSPTTYVGRTATMSCTSTPRRTTRSCPYRTRSEDGLPVFTQFFPSVPRITAHLLCYFFKVRFVKNVTQWREMKPAFYHGHVSFLDFTK